MALTIALPAVLVTSCSDSQNGHREGIADHEINLQSISNRIENSGADAVIFQEEYAAMIAYVAANTRAVQREEDPDSIERHYPYYFNFMLALLDAESKNALDSVNTRHWKHVFRSLDY